MSLKTITGIKRSVEVNRLEYDKHKEVINHWINGGDVKVLIPQNGWKEIDFPVFSLAFEYKAV